MQKRPTAQMRRRMMLVISVIIFIGFSAVIVQLFSLQVLNAEYYQERATAQQLRSMPIRATRGTIYDRNGKVLAKSGSAYEIYLVPVYIEDEKEAALIAKGLSEILGVDEAKVLQKALNADSYFESVKRQVEKPMADAVRQFALDNKISAIALGEDSKRYYPYGSFASTVLGFVGVDNQGLAGLEAHYDSILSGAEGKIVSAKNAKGADMQNYNFEQVYEAENGQSLVLTIDEIIQHYLEKHLETAVVQNDVYNRGVAIAMDVNTGEILGLAVKGDFDPNNPYTITDQRTLDALATLSGEEYTAARSAAQQAQWRNKAISDPYEPGSIYKIFTASAALEEKVTNPAEGFYCEGFKVVGGVKVSCHKTTGHGAESFAQGLINSCNPVFMEIGSRLGAERTLQYFNAFGFGEKTGIDLPGEAQSITHSLRTLQNVVSLSTSSFGQSFKVTPIQMITGISAIANGGTLVQPHIVKQILADDGTIVENIGTTEVRQVISQETCDLMTQLLQSVVEDGENKNGYVMGYHLAGKSGTSEKLDPDKLAEEAETGVQMRVASYMEFGPVDDPQIAVLVLLDEPHTFSKYGSVLAAPVVRNIMEDILPYLGFQPQYSQEELAQMDVVVPSLIGQTVEAAEAAVEELNLTTRVIGDGDRIVKQYPLSNAAIPGGGVVILYTQSDYTEKTVEVPNVIGSTPKQANYWLTYYGLNIRMEGSTYAGMLAAVQTPEAGTEVPIGTIVTVEFLSSSNAG